MDVEAWLGLYGALFLVGNDPSLHTNIRMAQVDSIQWI